MGSAFVALILPALGLVLLLGAVRPRNEIVAARNKRALIDPRQRKQLVFSSLLLIAHLLFLNWLKEYMTSKDTALFIPLAFLTIVFSSVFLFRRDYQE
jgi:drug/metabolite transporter (DMT)-like permease